jgi:hypothetical protein
MNPWIDWANWCSVHRWWLARNCPPVLRDERPSVRVFRITLLCGALGVIAPTLAGVGWAACEALSLPEFLSVNFPPLCFALLVLFPLSRWLGRGWLLTGFSGLVSIAAYWAGVWMFLTGADLIEHGPGDFSSTAGYAGGMLGGATGGLMLGLWMTHLGRRQAVIDVSRAVIAGTLGGLGFSLLLANQPEPWGTEWFPPLRVVISGQPHFPFQSLMAIALGLRLLPAAVPIPESEIVAAERQ